MSATRELLEVQIDGSQVIVGVFANAQEADRARGMLGADGFDLQSINVMAKSLEEAEELAPNRSSKNNQALTEPEADRMQGQVAVDRSVDGSVDGGSRINTGTAIGVLAGAGGGAAAGLAIREVPGIGALFTDNPLVALIIFGLIGAILGAWGGSVAGIQVAEEDTSYFTGELTNGAYLVAVRTNRIDEALDVLRDAGARNLTEYEGH
ncbi:MAG TPA: hypothetical protein VIL85_05925 [Thermomicrobiales bacterium]